MWYRHILLQGSTFPQPLLIVKWTVLTEKEFRDTLKVFAQIAECVTVMLYFDKRRAQAFTSCHFWFLIPHTFSLFVSYWPIYSLLRVKIQNNKKKCKVCEQLFTFFQKWCTCQLPCGSGRGVLLHLPFFDKHTISLASFHTPSPSLHLSSYLLLWFLLSLSLNVRWEEAARIIGHASVGLFDHVTRRRLHTYVPLNKPSNVAPEAEHGSKGSRGPVLCNDGKMEQFCLCWF